MSNKEDVMKPNKTQKGKNSVLVIAIGKDPKMGPGERKSPKAVKKAFNFLKNADKRAARDEKFKARAAKRAARAADNKAYEDGSASPEVKARIDESRKNKASGVNQNLRFANNKGGTQTKRMPKQPSRAFDPSQFDKLVERFSLSDKNSPGKLSSVNRMELARKLGIEPSMLTQDNSDLAQHNVFEAMKELGASRAGERKEARGSLNDFADKQGKKRGSNLTDPNDYSGPIQGADYPEMDEAMEGREDDSEEDTDPDLEEEGGEEEALGQAMHRLRMAGGRQPITSKDSGWGDESRGHHSVHGAGERGPRAGGGSIQTQPSTEMTQDFAHAGKTMSGFAGGDTDKPLGRVMPKYPTRLSSPQEEEEEEDLPEYPQMLTGEPMNLAFRLLKSMKKRVL